MTERLRRLAEPMLRFVVVRPVDSEPEFTRFTNGMQRTLVERAVRNAPRVVRLPTRLMP